MNTAFDWLSDLGPAFAAQESWRDGTYCQHRFFHYVYRADGPFAIACGAGLLAEHIRQFRFSPATIQRLGQVTDAMGRSLFHESFLNYLQRLRLRVQVNAAPEGAVLLPGEPLLTVEGPLAQIQLLESAFRLLFWESTHWATQASAARWNKKRLKEEETPSAPQYPFNPEGWKIRAAYIGGASADEMLKNVGKTARPMLPGEGLTVVAPSSAFTRQFIRQSLDGGGRLAEGGEASADKPESGEPLAQIRRLYKGTQPLGDIWLSEADEAEASVSRTHVRFRDERTGEPNTMQMTRFQNLYQPVLLKGHPALASPRLGYLRQRMLKQLEALHKVGLENYPRGHYIG